MTIRYRSHQNETLDGCCDCIPGSTGMLIKELFQDGDYVIKPERYHPDGAYVYDPPTQPTERTGG